MKTMEAEAYPQEILADEEPKYLRRQKPLEIKRRKFGKKAFKGYARVSLWAGIGVVAAGACYMVGHFLLAAPAMALLHKDQIRVSPTHYVAPDSVQKIFLVDRNHSVLRIPLDERRHQIESLPWVEQAAVRRALPNTIEVDITERAPIAFLREGNQMDLIDVHGVILPRPLKADFHFPVVTGIDAAMPLEDREQRMKLFAGFTLAAEQARGGAMEHVSEIDLTEAKDLRATISGLQEASPLNGAPNGADQWPGGDAPFIVHFGDSDFENKFYTVLNDVGEWHAKAGRIESVDLRFAGEAVVNPDRTVLAQVRTTDSAPAIGAVAPKPSHSAPAKKSARHAR
ncbi:MAG TPA: FtsQ-type POTRA domain-containing protein [Candidatus Acidoferrales bacterium]